MLTLNEVKVNEKELISKWQCRFCNKILSQQTKVKRHLTMCKNSPPLYDSKKLTNFKGNGKWECNLCHKSESIKTTFTKHMLECKKRSSEVICIENDRVNQNISGNKTWKCNYCNAQYSKGTRKNKHYKHCRAIKGIMESSNSTFEEVLKMLNNQNFHKAINDGKKLWKCLYCHLSFSIRYTKEEHFERCDKVWEFCKSNNLTK